MAEPTPTDPPPAAAKTKPSDSFVKNTLARLATAAVGIPILLWMLYWAPWWVFPAFCLLAIVRAAHELLRMTMVGTPLLYGWGLVASVSLALASLATLLAGTNLPEHGALFVALGVPEGGAYAVALTTLATITAVTAISVLLPLAHPEPNDRAGLRLAWLVAGPMYVGLLLAAIPGLFLVSNGTWVVLSMALAWGSDTGAYFAGRFFGKHKLAPTISPAKTVEGAIGGLVASVFFAVIGSVFFLPDLPLLHAVPLAIVANVLGQAGDLVESLIKRSTGVKDSGSILPGHGGLLDRIDALLFTAVSCLVYVLLTH
ncbi:MAG: phosphatidate cytidylyltransferase [Sandaracinaceae bacterium]|nr:phosphatidate cytidylyltransferase [Sandaracinaceae bacterium]